MAFNDDQIFYACLWWAKHLPGGADHADAICERYNKPQVEFPYYEPKYKPFDASEIGKSAVAREFNKLGLKQRLAKIRDGEFDKAAMEEISQPLPPEKIDTFFDELLRETKRKAADVIANNPNVEFNFIELKQSAATSSTHPAFPDHPFADEIEMAMNRAEIERGQLPQFGYVDIYSDGQMFVRTTVHGQTERDYFSEVFDYPNKPDLPYQHFSLTAETMDTYPRLSRKLTYRVVPLEEGQECRTAFPTVSGNKFVSDPRKAAAGEAILIQPHEFANPEDFELMRDEDITADNPAILGLSIMEVDRVLDGTVHLYPTRGERTDKPNVIHHYMDDIAFMIVNRPVQIGRTFSYTVAQPGDFIIRETEKSYPKIIKKKWIDEGKVTFILPDEKNPAPGTRGPRLN